VFGYEASDSLQARADGLPADSYRLLNRPPRYTIQTAPREKPEHVRPEIVRERGFENLQLLEERVAEFAYRPSACKKSYRMIVLRKRVGVDRGQLRLFEEYRYFFSITNDREMTAEEVVFSANDRCDQENLIAQLKSGVRALTTPVDDLVSNWAYMVMASLAWSLKAWSALLVPVTPRHRAQHEAEQQTLLRMEFATYCGAFIQLPCQIVRTGRRLIYRLLSWNPWQGVFLRLVERLQACWRCGSDRHRSRGLDAPIRRGHEPKKGGERCPRRNRGSKRGQRPPRGRRYVSILAICLNELYIGSFFSYACFGSSEAPPPTN
jgi:hypothetical protein